MRGQNNVDNPERIRCVMKNYSAIYVHVPFCKARCKYCAFSSCVNSDLVSAYLTRLEQEIASANLVGGDNKISTIFLGGGTPSVLGAKNISRIFSALKNKFDLSSVSEITVECNPESVSDELFDALVNAGVNRVSFGLQSVNNGTLKAIGRLHDFDGFLSALDVCHNHGITNVNADLILGLPESAKDFCHSVDVVSNLPLTHVSVYALEVHPNTPFADYCQTHFPHTDDELADLYDYACAKLSASGFSRYEISNFAKSGYACRHNLNYWQEGRYYGFGPSASAFVGNVRYRNVYDVSTYVSSVNVVEQSEVISAHDEQSEFVMLSLRLSSGFSLSQFSNRFGVDFFSRFPQATELAKLGMLSVGGDVVRIPDDKIYVCNSILADLVDFDD